MKNRKLLDKESIELLSDEELVLLASENDIEATHEIISRFNYTINQRAKSFAKGASDDLAQEGLMALLMAIKTYDSSNGVKFLTYANTCIKNRMILTFKKDNKLNSKERAEVTEEIADCDSTYIPENVLLEKEWLDEVFDKVYSTLSELEWNVFQLYLSGLAYNQIALKMEISVKVVDNAMQRVRRKLKVVLR